MKPAHVMLVALVATILIVALAIMNSPDAVPQTYLPPRAQPQAEEPMEYYAEDWIVYDTQQRVVCKDPYIRKDVKIIQCVSAEKVR